MNCSALLHTYQQSPRLLNLSGRLAIAPEGKKGTRIYLQDLRGSASQFVAAALFTLPAAAHLNHLFICNDEEDAAYFHNTMESLTEALNLFYFPSSFKNRKNFRLLNPSHVMLRTEALTRFSAQTGARAGAMVTYPEALHEKVVLPTAISKNMIHLKSGDVIQPDTLFARLVGYGFERTDFVYGPGQFAVRGGILDIYSFGNEKPYRIELFGNDIDSIRIIDPETQLSERRLQQVSIIPNVDTQFDDADKVSLLSFLPKDTVIWFQDEALCREKLLTAEEDLGQFLQLLPTMKKSEEEEEDKMVKKEVHLTEFTPVAQFFGELEARHTVHFGHSRPDNIELEIAFQTREQPAFNRQFDMLIADLKSWEAKGFALHIFAENPKQLERLYSIFNDLKEQITFNPIATSIHEGFIDEELKIVCYTDHQIFQRYHKYRVKQAYNKNKALTLRALRELQPGDFVTHIDHGVGVYSGLQKIEVAGKMQEAVRIIYKDSDILYVIINSLH